MARRIIGIAIEPDNVTVVSLKAGFKKTGIETIRSIKIPETEDGLVIALKRVLEATNTANAVCIASIPSRDVSFRNLTLPFNQSKKIRQVLPYELEQHLPFATDRLAIDFYRLPNGTTHTASQIIAATVDQERLNQYLDALIACGIKPDSVTVGGFPAAQWLCRISDSGEDKIILDIQKRSCTLFIIRSGAIQFIRSFPILATPDLHMDSLCADILRSISAFEHQFNIAFNPQRVFVSSFLSSRSDFTDALSKRLKLPVQVVDIVDEMQIQVNEETEELWNPVLMNNALALAVMASGRINGFNFYRESFANQKLWSKYGKQLILSAVLSGLVAGISLFDLFYETHHLNRRASAIDGEMIRTFKETLPQITRIVDPLHQMRTKLAEEKKAAQYFGETGSSMRLIDILSHISRLIPASIDLDMTRIVTGPGDVTISGNTDTFNTVNTIKTRLEHSDQFQRVAISSANMDKSGNRIRFKLKIDF